MSHILNLKKTDLIMVSLQSGEKYIKRHLSKTKMALNLNGEEGWPLYSSDRIAQLIGNGILTFLWNKGSMKNLISENHAVYFRF